MRERGFGGLLEYNMMLAENEEEEEKRYSAICLSYMLESTDRGGNFEFVLLCSVHI